MSPKVTINPTPSEQLIAQAIKEHVITDATGRKITLCKPPVLTQFRFLDAVGDASQRYMNATMPLIFVTDIDGSIVPPLEKKAHIEALIVRLGDAGIEAVGKGVDQYFGEVTPEEDKAKLKN